MDYVQTELRRQRKALLRLLPGPGSPEERPAPAEALVLREFPSPEVAPSLGAVTGQAAAFSPKEGSSGDESFFPEAAGSAGRRAGPGAARYPAVPRGRETEAAGVRPEDSETVGNGVIRSGAAGRPVSAVEGGEALPGRKRAAEAQETLPAAGEAAEEEWFFQARGTEGRGMLSPAGRAAGEEQIFPARETVRRVLPASGAEERISPAGGMAGTGQAAESGWPDAPASFSGGIQERTELFWAGGGEPSGAKTLSRMFQRDARRYDGGFPLY